MIVLGIETSCDDTSVAVVRNGREVLSSIVSSQIKVHAPYGGVVPELASREHIKNLPIVFQTALREAKVSVNDIDLIGVTVGPGLLGALLVGVSFAKGLSFASNIPFVALNHIECHIQSAFIEYGEKIELPAMAFVVSGGHTHLFYLNEKKEIKLLAKTRDDAVGEAFDKFAKMLNLGYPGGPIIDKLAQRGEPTYKLPIPKMSDGSDDMSFSGIKTFLLRTIEKEKEDLNIENLAASFQKTVADILIKKIKRFEREFPAKSILLTGGVSANSYLRKRFKDEFGEKFFVPSPKFSTDNAAMVASLAFERKGQKAELHQECFPTLFF
ncbi:N6-L-threonylcarbamoyladenine synthase [Thermotomaculum hydrothermale]|uniref:tRNA N6-adenosine threonylcarbamoyltransferase n=1 Tax=Thermotomaculum hydrothermale TaxID=981385 RepID=A0A7R6SXJ1_9BACT|nr:tRNA (adenosine(37)-N6)-threonylcarbamoyltransferase complex transferase subunit TsaD [Thermotomaculum hydrothermale]BBB31844.1 N6-L-threonylcarbamoyladenine synthase [Thermotomaculum hydrothermale]